MAISGFDSVRARLASQVNRVGYTGTWREAAVQRKLLPVYDDWECCYALTADGDVVFSAEVDWRAPARLTNLRHRFVVLAAAADEYPELAYLRPIRRPGDPTCSSCGGTGRPKLPPGTGSKIVCECGGLGWYPAGTELGAV